MEDTREFARLIEETEVDLKRHIASPIWVRDVGVRGISAWPLDESVGGGPALGWPFKKEDEMADMQDEGLGTETPETESEEWERKDGRWLRLQALNAASRGSRGMTTATILMRADAFLAYLKTGEVPVVEP